MATPSLAFLLRHELRIWSRRLIEMRGRGRLYGALFIVAGTLLHLLALGIVTVVGRLPADLSPALVLPLLSMTVFMLLTLIVAQALSGATRTFFDVGAGDFVLTAPVPPQRLFAIRALALAIMTTAPFAVFVLPIANVGALVDGPRWLTLYPMLVSMGLLGAAVGMALAMLLVRTIGPRFSRSAGQIGAVLIGTGLGFGVQWFNHLGVSEKLSLVEGVMRSSLSPGGGWSALLWIPGRALAGEARPLLAVSLLSLGAFAGIVTLMAGRYLRSRQDAAGMAEQPRRSRLPGTKLRFGSSPLVALRRKEWRLLTRDPWILMPVLQRAIALVPVSLALSGLGSRGDVAASVAAPMLVVFAGKLASGIAWLTLSAEEAPELIGTAPVSARTVERAKLEAALSAAAALFVLPIALLAWRSPAAAGFALLGCTAATLGATMLALAEPAARRRRSLNERFHMSVPFVLAELLVTLCLSGAVWLAVEGRLTMGGIAAAVAGAVLALFLNLMKAGPGAAKTIGAPTGEGSPLPVRSPQALSRKPS
jgi:ABC-2 type transport system permease protein